MLIENQTIAAEELDVVKLFEEKRWGQAPQCPYCGSTRLSKRRKDLRFKCLNCKRSGSVTVNSALHDTRLPLSLWLKAFSITADSGRMPVAQHLQKELNISYKSAIRMRNKIEGLIIDTDAVPGVNRENLMESLLLNSMKQPQQSEQEVVLAESPLVIV